MDISELQRVYAGHPNTKGLAALLEDSSVRTIFLGGLHASAAALFVSSFLRENKQTFVFVLGDLEEAGYFYHDLPLIPRLALKEALKKIEGTDLEKILKEYNAI